MTVDTVQPLCKLLFALPFLPACEIAMAFDNLEGKASSVDHFVDNLSVLFTYVLCGQWPPHTWSVYNRPIRVNNDLEGWPTSMLVSYIIFLNMLHSDIFCHPNVQHFLPNIPDMSSKRLSLKHLVSYFVAQMSEPVAQTSCRPNDCRPQSPPVIPARP